jgi:pyruvate dehydrogenase E2 component (dihydrolipoamide acetyltransferase)
MSESKATAPHFYVSMDIEMSRALELRDSLKARDVEISVNDLILRAATLALLKHPMLNAQFAGEEVHVFPHINLAVAVALDEGLITPVIHNCEALSLVKLAAAAKMLVENTRAGRLRPQDLESGTFTVTNLGMFGVTHFHAIVNPPQAAILAVGTVRRVPAFDEHDRVVARQWLNATVSADHRVTDGAAVARFLQEVKRILEDAFELI